MGILVASKKSFCLVSFCPFGFSLDLHFSFFRHFSSFFFSIFLFGCFHLLFFCFFFLFLLVDVHVHVHSVAVQSVFATTTAVDKNRPGVIRERKRERKRERERRCDSVAWGRVPAPSPGIMPEIRFSRGRRTDVL